MTWRAAAALGHAAAAPPVGPIELIQSVNDTGGEETFLLLDAEPLPGATLAIVCTGNNGNHRITSIVPGTWIELVSNAGTFRQAEIYYSIDFGGGQLFTVNRSGTSGANASMVEMTAGALPFNVEADGYHNASNTNAHYGAAPIGLTLPDEGAALFGYRFNSSQGPASDAEPVPGVTYQRLTAPASEATLNAHFFGAAAADVLGYRGRYNTGSARQSQGALATFAIP